MENDDHENALAFTVKVAPKLFSELRTKIRLTSGIFTLLRYMVEMWKKDSPEQLST